MLNDEQQREIFIKNIPYDISEEDLFEWCSTFGSVHKCTLKLDKDLKSRGFAFVIFATIEGHNNILSKGPHYCNKRPLQVKSAYNQTNSVEETSSQNPNVVEDEENDLISYRDELDANLECMQIAHEHEIKILRDKLAREEKLRDEAKQLYSEAEEDWKIVHEESQRLRACLIKNVVQTFNIRRDFARKIKEQAKKTQELQEQYETTKKNQKFTRK